MFFLVVRALRKIISARQLAQDTEGHGRLCGGTAG
jgi:hypothetical protein